MSSGEKSCYGGVLVLGTERSPIGPIEVSAVGVLMRSINFLANLVLSKRYFGII
jgi:hypothetical protein